MLAETTNPAACNCLALRQAARHVSQFYDQFLAPSGLRTTQYSILARLQRRGPMTINALAAELVMDRTTLGRNILPLQRDGLVAVGPGKSDRRRKELRLTDAGAARFARRDSKRGARRKRDSKRPSAPSGPRSCARSCTKSQPTSGLRVRRPGTLVNSRNRFPSAKIFRYHSLRRFGA